eukprot:763026-Hanusia_phi.AAC.2
MNESMTCALDMMEDEICAIMFTMNIPCASCIPRCPQNSSKTLTNSILLWKRLLPGTRAMASVRRIAAREEATQTTRRTTVGTNQPASCMIVRSNQLIPSCRREQGGRRKVSRCRDKQGVEVRRDDELMAG